MNKDAEEWTVKGHRHSDDWHLDAYGQDPTPFYRNPFAGAANRAPYPWRPGLSPNSATDPLVPFPATSLAAYISGAKISVFGTPPINRLSTITGAPQTPTQGTIGGGGSIPAGTYILQLVAVDSAGGVSGPSNYIVAAVGSGSSSITIPNIVFDAAAVGWQLYAGFDSQHMWSVMTDSTTPTSITIIDLDPLFNVQVRDVGRPDVAAVKFRLIITPIRHGGVWGGGVTAVATHTLAVPSSPTVNEWAGRVVSRFASSIVINSGGIGPALFDGLRRGGGQHLLVSSNDNAGVLTVPNTLTGLTATPVAIGDVYVMRAYANIASANTIGDSAFVNSLAPSGLDTDAEAGKVVWIIAGTGKGQRAKIASNDATTLTIDGEWATVPNSTSVFVVLEPAPALSVDGSVFDISQPIGTQLIAGGQLPITQAGSYLVQVVTVDANGRISVADYAPWQEVYLVPPASVAADDGYVTVPISSGHATIDLAGNTQLNQRLTLTGASVTVDAPVSTGGSIVAGATFTLYLRQDATGNRNPATLLTVTNAAGAFVAGVETILPYSPTANTDTAITFTFHGTYWAPDLPGAAIS